MLALTAGEGSVTLLDFHGGGVWKERLKVLDAYCGASRQTSEENVSQIVLGEESGLIVMYQLTLEFTPDFKVHQCVLSKLETWNLAGGDVLLDSLTFSKDYIVASCNGSVYLLRQGGTVACVTNAMENVPSRTTVLSEKHDYLVNARMDGSVRIFSNKNAHMYTFNLLELSKCPSDVLFSYKTSKELLRKGETSTFICCSWLGNTWLVDEKANVLFFQLDIDQGVSVLAFEVYRTQEGESYIVYLTSNGNILFYLLDLTCIECRLFAQHAHQFVQDHPLWGGLNQKQRLQLIEHLMSSPPRRGEN